MSQPQIQSGFVTPDGKIFNTKKEAVDYLRKPLIKDALLKLTSKNEDLTAWLIEKQEDIETAYETGTIRRVTKSESKQLAKALEVLKATSEKGLAFLRDNADAIQNSFRWPSVKRMDEAEKSTAIDESLGKIAEGNAELVAFIKANKDAIFACYEAGVEKREVSQKTLDALAAARAKRNAEKKPA